MFLYHNLFDKARLPDKDFLQEYEANGMTEALKHDILLEKYTKYKKGTFPGKYSELPFIDKSVIMFLFMTELICEQGATIRDIETKYKNEIAKREEARRKEDRRRFRGRTSEPFKKVQARKGD